VQIHRVRGSSLEDALRRAQRTYGEGALVVGHEVTAGGVTVAVSQKAAAREIGGASGGAGGAVPRRMEEVERRLSATGCSEAFARRVGARLGRRLDPDQHPLDLAAKAIGAMFRVARLPVSAGTTRVVCFAGNTGAGKTTGLVKLGARLVRAGRRVGLATLDSRRVGAVEQLRAYARLLGTPLAVLKADTAPSAESVGAVGHDVVLLDTTGRPDYDLPRLMQLRAALRARATEATLDSFLVLPATSSRAAALEVSESHGDLQLGGCVITKLDETRRPGPIFEHVLELGLPIAFLSDGQDIARAFHRAQPDHFADALLLGRVA